MKSDARFLINQRRMKKPSNIIKRTSHGVMDARKILNSKLRKRPGLYSAKSANASIQQHPFSNFRRTTSSSYASNNIKKIPDKRVKLAKDGNIVITAKSKDLEVSSEKLPHTRIQARWVPSNVETADLEHVGINDVLDMDTLPSVPLASHNMRRTLAEEMVEMQNTMVADQISTPPTSVSVSNLHFTVSKQDIMELFGDIGLVKSVEMPRPGFAIVEYFDHADALKACDLYHNRLLDGQPMQCSLQQPKRSLISHRLGDRVAAPSTSSRAVYNPRNVRFTVKLT